MEVVELIISGINAADVFWKLIGSPVVIQGNSWRGLKDELKTLERNVFSIKDVLLAAEKRRHQKNAMKIWFDDLRDIFCDAENVLDKIECQELKKQLAKKQGMTGKVSRFFSSSNPIAFRVTLSNKVNNIRKRIDEIEERSKGFSFTSKQMAPSVSACNFIGTDKDKEYFESLQSIYDNFSSDLQHCFEFCSIFPNDYVFDSRYLVHCWMANGLVETGDEEMEDVGLGHLDTLVSKCFFEDVKDHGLCYTFRMHDLVHTFAKSVASEEYSRVFHGTHNIDPRVRYMSMVESYNFEGLGVDRFFDRPKQIRTIFFPERRYMFGSRSFLKKCILNLKYLRMLRMNNTSFEELPDSIGSLKHLRFLDLSWNIFLKKLPKSVCEFQSLQTLNLVGCRQLKRLPSHIRNLISLRLLEITTRGSSLPNIKKGRWSSLRHLSIHDCLELKYLFEGMEHVTNLRSLSIRNCPQLRVDLPETLYRLRELKELKIQDSYLSAQCRGDSRLNHIQNVQLY